MMVDNCIIKLFLYIVSTLFLKMRHDALPPLALFLGSATEMALSLLYVQHSRELPVCHQTLAIERLATVVEYTRFL